MKKVNLELTIDEVNKILESLSNMPYKHVYELINTIRSQAAGQLETSPIKEGETSDA